MSDPLNDTLTSLRTDADRVPLADSDAVRRRGNQRTRRQAVGGSLAVVALVAGAVGIGGALTGTNKADAPPANPTVSTTLSPHPSPSGSAEDVLGIADQPFLPVAALTAFAGYDRVGPFIDAGQEPKILPEQCAVRPGGWEASEVRSTRYYQDGSEAEIREYVLRFDDAATAEQASLKRAYADLVDTCPATVDPSEGMLSTRYSVVVPGLDMAVQSSRYFVPAVDSEPSYYEVATAHQGNVVVVLEWQASGNPAGDGAEDWVWDAQRLQTALDRAVG